MGRGGLTTVLCVRGTKSGSETKRAGRRVGSAGGRHWKKQVVVRWCTLSADRCSWRPCDGFSRIRRSFEKSKSRQRWSGRASLQPIVSPRLQLASLRHEYRSRPSSPRPQTVGILLGRCNGSAACCCCCCCWTMHRAKSVSNASSSTDPREASKSAGAILTSGAPVVQSPQACRRVGRFDDLAANHRPRIHHFRVTRTPFCTLECLIKPAALLCSGRHTFPPGPGRERSWPRRLITLTTHARTSSVPGLMTQFASGA